ncbi:MAG: transglutaminase-like domain-containing protein [Polyangiales bacterium]
MSRFAFAFGVAVSAIALPALADAPVVHEYVPFDPTTEGELGVVTTEGGFPAKQMTMSGEITAPDVGRPITDKTPTYSTKPSVPDEKFVPDRDVRRVDHLPYDDPFRPRLAPFKRLVAFDEVGTDYSLKVHDKKHDRVDVGKEISTGGITDTFYVSLALDLRAGEPIRIPSAIAGSKIKRAHMSPSVGFHLERDGAENLFVVGDAGGAARLVLEMDAPRSGFGGTENNAATWATIASGGVKLWPLPASVQKVADVVAKDHVKVDKTVHDPKQVIHALTDYFRAFKDSEDPPPNSGDVYFDIATSKKGVCRHRSFAFMITAIGLGIPTRFIHNEAHAWVEVYDGFIWKRIDLGGAGRTLDDKSEKPEKPQPAYEAQPDPYNWPAGATKGSDLVPPSSPAPAPTNTGSTPSTPPPSTSSSIAPSTAPPSKVTLQLTGIADEYIEVVRNKTVSVKGRIVESGGGACKGVRVEFILRSTKGLERQASGSLVTDDTGNYDGAIGIPSDVAPDDYTIVAHTPGAGTCGQGTSE